MSPGPGPRSRELDDDSLLRIFSKVGCARELATLSLVCKRWRNLSCKVSHISFVLDAATRKELRSNEGIVSSALCRASSKAPGSLKHLCITLGCQEQPAEVHGHWLQWTTSLTKLELTVSSSLQWGPGVWNSIVRMKTLEEVTIEGNFSTEKHLLLPQALENGLQMTKLQNCNISCDIDMVETIFATCPALRKLQADCEEKLANRLRVTSNSLKDFELFLNNPDGFKATVDAPSLMTLRLIGSGPISMHCESAQSLRTLFLRSSSYKLYGPLENLQELRLSGLRDLQRLPEVLMLTPAITDLHLRDPDIAAQGRIDIDYILAPLVSLRNIYLYRDAISYLRAGERRFEALNVHLWPSRSSAPKLCLLKALIEVHRIQSLVVHCEGIIDYQTKTFNDAYTKWRFLFELSHFYPDRVRFID